jgi:hypothetical protein
MEINNFNPNKDYKDMYKEPKGGYSLGFEEREKEIADLVVTDKNLPSRQGKRGYSR